MFRDKPTPSDAVRAALLEQFRASNTDPTWIEYASEIGFDDFFYRAMARKRDRPTQLVFVEWMVCRLLGIGAHHTRRVPLDHAQLRFTDSYVIELYNLPGQGGEKHYVLCCPRRDIDRTLSTWEAWCPDNWEYFFYSRVELEASGVFAAVPFEHAVKRYMMMKPAEFQFVARARLGMEP